jgi:hypothetical protein
MMRKFTLGRPYSSTIEDGVSVLFDELELSLRWKRPSILIAVVPNSKIAGAAKAKLTEGLTGIGQTVISIKVSEAEFDVPLMLSRHPQRAKSIFFVTGLKNGGGSDGFNAYRALNIRRELLVDYSVRLVLWVSGKESVEMPRRAPDFWAFRHRVVEFGAD